jgi:hypothetical protein
MLPTRKRKTVRFSPGEPKKQPPRACKKSRISNILDKLDSIHFSSNEGKDTIPKVQNETVDAVQVGNEAVGGLVHVTPEWGSEWDSKDSCDSPQVAPVSPSWAPDSDCLAPVSPRWIFPDSDSEEYVPVSPSWAPESPVGARECVTPPTPVTSPDCFEVAGTEPPLLIL